MSKPNENKNQDYLHRDGECAPKGLLQLLLVFACVSIGLRALLQPAECFRGLCFVFVLPYQMSPMGKKKIPKQTPQAVNSSSIW